MALVRLLFDAMVRLLAWRNLRSDRFGTLAAILGVALGTATVSVVLVIDVNTLRVETGAFTTDPSARMPDTVALRGFDRRGVPVEAFDPRTTTHEDYEVMRSAVRLASLAAFLVGALIVFFTFGVVVDRRRREVALLRSLGAEPRQVAAIFLREAILIGIAGAALGFLATAPLSALAAKAGITTTGRNVIAARSLVFPWARMVLVAAVGAGTAVLGVIRPVRDVLRLDVPRALLPRFLDDEAPSKAARRAHAVTLVALPFGVLVYTMMRPFFRRALPSLTFFVVEAALTAVAFLATLRLVPELVRRLGGLTVRLIPAARSAVRLLTQRRVERQGHDLSWSVSGVMLVFALLLALHVATLALRREVVVWADGALHGELFVIPDAHAARAAGATALLPRDEVVAHLSARTPWPNGVQAARAEELARLCEANGDPAAAALARKLGPGRAILSRMMARRLRLSEGDALEVSGRGGTRRLAIVAVTDAVGFVPLPMPYRNAKTYVTLDEADQDLILPYAAPVGATAVLASDGGARIDAWLRDASRERKLGGVHLQRARAYRASRIVETDRDFVIFDVILALTTALAALGIANQLILGVHARRREIGLYRVLGMTTAQVRRLVVLEGAFIGLLGGGLAALLGVPLGYAAVGALRAVSAFDVSFALPARYVVMTMAGAVGVAVAASLYPAAMAARADSAESVHYE